MKTLLVLSVLAAVLAGCNEKIEKARPDEGTVIPTSLCGPGEFETIKAIVLTNRCNTCHDRHLTRGVDLTNYAGIKASLGKVEAELRKRTMPVGRPLPRAEEELVLKWIEGGAPEVMSAETKKKCDEANQPPPIAVKPLAPNYESIKDKILEGKCLSCHQPGESGELYDFSSYAGIQLAADLFDTSMPEASPFIKAVVKEGRGSMPPARSGIARVTPDEVKVLTEWIRLGLPERAKGD